MGERIAPLGPVQTVLPTPAAAQAAAEAQAKISGNGANYALQSKVQTQVADEDRFGQGVARQKRNAGLGAADPLLAALRRVESKKKQQENGDEPRHTPPWELLAASRKPARRVKIRR